MENNNLENPFFSPYLGLEISDEVETAEDRERKYIEASRSDGLTGLTADRPQQREKFRKLCRSRYRGTKSDVLQCADRSALQHR